MGIIQQLIQQFSIRIQPIISPETWMRINGPRCIIPLYHLVHDDPPAHIRHLYAIKSVAEFKQDLEYLLKHYQPIGVADLLANVQNDKPWEKPVFLLTFDDGLRECKMVIDPILKSYGLEAICFLNSDFIDNRGLFYRYLVSLILDYLEKHQEGSLQATNWLIGKGQDLQNGLRPYLLSAGYADKHLLEGLATHLGLDLPTWLNRHRPYLTSEEILAMAKDGWTFGAHSIDHPMYNTLNQAEQVHQTGESLDKISNLIHNDLRLFAFPFTDAGVSETFFKQMYQSLNVSLSFGTAGLKSDIDRRHLQRIPFEGRGMEAAQLLTYEYLYYMLKAPFGLNKVHRKPFL
jgi:peptidoglycan/xylan/chitin deacetylase (PgdA/CDA1 family)